MNYYEINDDWLVISYLPDDFQLPNSFNKIKFKDDFNKLPSTITHLTLSKKYNKPMPSCWSIYHEEYNFNKSKKVEFNSLKFN